jgi:hypothetical protein
MREWGGMILEGRTEYGMAARHNRGRYAGQKVHSLRVEYVIGLLDDYVPNGGAGSVGQQFIKTGKPVRFSAYPMCGVTQGQWAASPINGATIEQVTCAKCLARLAPVEVSV